jgi:hypothetical protein
LKSAGISLFIARNAKEEEKKTTSSTGKVPTEKSLEQLDKALSTPTQITRTRATLFAFAPSSSSHLPSSSQKARQTKGPPTNSASHQVRTSQQKTNSMLGIVFSDP